MRLIDADAIDLQPDGHGVMNKVLFVGRSAGKTIRLVQETLKSMIDNAPTIDAVPVVRCEDCVYRADPMECPMCFEELTDLSEDEWDSKIFDCAVDGGFCHRGKRKDGDTE